MKSPAPRVLPRGRVAKWSREQIDKLSTPELRALYANAQRLKETEVAGLCDELLSARPRGHAVERHARRPGEPRLVSREKAFAIHGAKPRSRIWSCGALREDGAVLLTMRAQEVRKAAAARSCLLWAPNVAGSNPWADSPGGQERLEHCRIALERGAAEGLLIYGKHAQRVDPQTVLALSVEKRDDEYWASWVSERRIPVKTVE